MRWESEEEVDASVRMVQRVLVVYKVDYKKLLPLLYDLTLVFCDYWLIEEGYQIKSIWIVYDWERNQDKQYFFPYF